MADAPENAPKSAAWDVAIIGNGFAGALLGAALSRQGLRVVILERKKQANHDTKSGNIIRADIFKSFDLPVPPGFTPVASSTQLCIDGDLLVKRVVRPAGKEAPAKPSTQAQAQPQDTGFGLYAFQRNTLNHLLADQVQKAGVTVFEDFTVEDILTGGAGPACVRSAERSVTARLVVVASGTEEQVLKHNGLVRDRGSKDFFYGIAQRLQKKSPNQAGQPAARPRLMQVHFPPRKRAARFGLLLNWQDNLWVTLFGRFASSQLMSPHAQFSQAIEGIKNHILVSDLADYDPLVSDWRARILGPCPLVPRKLYGDRLLVVGDAALPMGGSLAAGAGFHWAAQTVQAALRVIPDAIRHPSRYYLRPYARAVHRFYTDGLKQADGFSRPTLFRLAMRLLNIAYPGRTCLMAPRFRQLMHR